MTTRREFLDYLARKDSEGGVIDFLYWGGIDAFPVELAPQAIAFKYALDVLEAASDALAAQLGVDVDDWWHEAEDDEDD